MTGSSGVSVRQVTVRVPAKINLQLRVGPRRADGYHELVNVFHAVSVCDEVSARSADRVRVVVQGAQTSGVPTGDDNLAARAASLLAREVGRSPGVELGIRKTIPVAGGMAGGSADAAAALVACDALWGTGLGPDRLHALAAALGSDVPFALLGGTAVGLGRGERLTALPVGGTFHWVLAVFDDGLSTARVYAECDRLRAERDEQAEPPEACEALLAVLRAGDASALGPMLANDLQEAALALRPGLRRVLDTGRAAGAPGALVSGSGPTCAFLVRSESRARSVADAIAEAGVARAVLRAYGPVAGARVTEAR
ncbi:MAG: 4-(cytidine 5'-diphospho)-2-C-methyl-D-erythritol kinase [Streptosporangiaceae bacterium]